MDFDNVFDARYDHFQRSMEAYAAQDVNDILTMSEATLASRFVEFGCGDGRLLRELARRGFKAAGVDASRWMVVEAMRRSKHERLRVEVVPLDLRVSPTTSAFDIAISWFTSFGYFEDAECRSMLANMRKSLRPEGVLVMDLVNKDYLLLNLKRKLRCEHENRLMIDSLRFDSTTGRLYTRREYSGFPSGESGVIEFFVRLLAFPELRDWLLSAGFHGIELSSDSADGEPPARLRVRAYA